MSKADKMLEKLGYKKYTSDDCIMYMKDLFMITFILDNKTFVTEYKQGDYNFPKIKPFEVNMQELQAINKKVEELRMDMTVRDFLNNILNTRTRKKKYQIRYGAGYYTFYVEDFKFINDANGTGLVIGKILDDEIEVL